MDLYEARAKELETAQKERLKDSPPIQKWERELEEDTNRTIARYRRISMTYKI